MSCVWTWLKCLMVEHDSKACKIGWLSFKIGKPWLSILVGSCWESSQSVGGVLERFLWDLRKLSSESLEGLLNLTTIFPNKTLYFGGEGKK